MPDMASIGAAVSSLKAAHDIAKGMLSIRDAGMIQGKVIELQREILSAQSSALAAQSDQFTLLKAVGDLEKETARLKAWEAEKQRYALSELSAGTFAYVLKAEAQGAEPIHRICTSCYELHRKSILQRKGSDYDGTWLKCPACKAEVHVKGEDAHRPYFA